MIIVDNIVLSRLVEYANLLSSDLKKKKDKIEYTSSSYPLL